MDKRFLRAYTDPNEVEFCGRRLYPFCLKYRVYLNALGSPIVCGGTIGPEDLLVAVQVCSESRVGPFNLIERWRLLRLASNPPEFERQLARFATYIYADHWPKFWEKKSSGKSRDTGIPWPMSVVANLIANGIDEHRAWHMPECQAIWLSCTFSINKGADINVLTTGQEEQMDEMEKELKASAAVANPPKEKTD